ncbi:putative disease resistance protein At1g50180 [Humulus lupulus]|uniref:putative disease resistance protein At1g50180 n=1 Tax=Humulus lupulus TaxID=3486 RepID=UPI002B40A0BA|nr:putative disease resistance protein At1g50180 [Humulus lupulus]XP_062083816.1 putative disease resistance protein At1g50180 [Humulus lupulus]XP_062083817.1 putative disease resistance protein At1g50180 [Humulus lupulus]XP_062083818.1 putative disease resistance protein At1g50180 [Humulus lupulus]XP_062083819.1 putative disease resistance protein At1g50180 [Humulus lupulus]XP_062083820.1 putative disease resistance protein At1g50180 [Humulus lupulus]XP_062083821.1 putative disease resistanc
MRELFEPWFLSYRKESMAEDMTYMSGWKLIKSNTLLQLYISIVKPFKQTYISFTQQHEEKQDMAVSEAIVSAVVERLGDLLISEAKFLSGVRAQVEDAQTKLEFMRCFLRDADAHGRDGNAAVRLWVVKVRDTSYDLEDVIETYIFKVASDRHGRGIISVLKGSACIFSKAIEIHRAGSKLEKISSRISDLRSNLDMFNSDNIIKKDDNDIQQQRKLRRTYSHVVESDVVGFDKDIEELVARLTAEKSFQSPRVISVFGMGGLGKTTLARKVYHHPQVRSHFDYFAWASISQQCNRRNVWEEILFAFTSPTKERREIQILNDGELAEELYNFQKEKKCLVLLDDIWSTDTWDLLKHAFPRGDIDSKILLTTRIMNIGPYANQHCYIHQPTRLDENQSWELFQNKSSYFGKDQTSIKDAERMEALGQEMLKWCFGFPLAIIVLGGLLSTKHSVDEWEEMKRNVVRYISKGIIKGREHGDSECHGVSSMLDLSYDELPFYLKPCFLYLARYPEDAIIRVKELCLMLMAEEGLILPRRHPAETIEDVAYDYLSELVERSMVQVENWGLRGKMKTFRIHDLMRDLCVSKAQDENFLHLIDLRSQVEEPLKPVSTVTRRVSIYSHSYSGDDVFSFLDSLNGSLRCLTIYWGGTIQQDLRHVFNSFFMLRILILRCSSYNSLKLPKEIGKLIHLRLLSIDGPVEKIPSSIGNLRCLQTLALRLRLWWSFERIPDVPDVIWKLEQLRYLHFCNTPVRKLRLANIRNLQTLKGVSTEWLDCNDFLQLRNLKKLDIFLGENLENIYHDPPTVTFDCLRHLQLVQH